MPLTSCRTHVVNPFAATLVASAIIPRPTSTFTSTSFVLPGIAETITAVEIVGAVTATFIAEAGFCAAHAVASAAFVATSRANAGTAIGIVGSLASVLVARAVFAFTDTDALTADVFSCHAGADLAVQAVVALATVFVAFSGIRSACAPGGTV